MPGPSLRDRARPHRTHARAHTGHARARAQLAQPLAALRLQPTSVVLVITKDINLRVKCDAVGVVAQDYYKDHVDEDVDNLRGYRSVEIEPAMADKFYEAGSILAEEIAPNINLEENIV